MAADHENTAARHVGADLARRIDQAWAALLTRREALLAWHASGGPAAAPVSPDAAWDPGRILAHLAEMLRYWQGEMERILAASGAPITVGRFGLDTIRVLTVERDRDLPVDDLLGRIEVDARRVAARFRSLDEAALGKPASHRFYLDRGQISLGDIAAASLAGHFEAHLAQLDEALASAG